MVATTTRPTKLEAMKNVFKNQVWLVKDEAGDKKLAELAKEIIAENWDSAAEDTKDSDKWKYHGKQATELLFMLPPPREVPKELHLLETRDYLWTMILTAYRFFRDEDTGSEFARTLLALEMPDQEIKGGFEAALRREFEGLGPIRLLDFLNIATVGDNPLVMRKALQTLPAVLPIEVLLFGTRCMSAAIDGLEDFRSQTGVIRLIKELSARFIGKAFRIALAADDLRSRLPNLVHSEGGCKISFSDQADHVTFTWRTARRKDEDIRRACDAIRTSVLEPVRTAATSDWRRAHPDAASLKVTFEVQIMGPTWTTDDESLDKLEQRLPISFG